MNLRNESTPQIINTCIDVIFGIGKNGVSEQAWLCLESSHLDVGTLRVATTNIMIDGTETAVRIFEIKVTPSVKNAVYSMYIIFTTDEIYVRELSKCDCLNGWLLCSHTLACFLLFYLIQQQDD